MPPPELARLNSAFATLCGSPPAAVASAPGRVNLIGEHTDYNDGFVLPVALTQRTFAAVRPRDDDAVRAWALDLDEAAAWSLGDWHAPAQPRWSAYVAGVVALLRERGVPLGGCDVAFTSDVPIGGGLSSSAALELAVACALLAATHRTLEPQAVADLCRAAEHRYARVPCGIMDQYVGMLARAEHALLLDCRSRTWRHVPLRLGEHELLIVDSGVRHDLAASAYAARQGECGRAVAHFAAASPGVTALRDVTPELLARHSVGLDALVAARARHVVSENARTLAAAAALEGGDVPAFGRLMDASHASLRDDYGVSCSELDRLVEIIRGVAGVQGARMTGGGFGGCVVVLARRDCRAAIEHAVRARYDAAGLGPARLVPCVPGRGARVEGA